jgi:adenylosuccinate lyase
VTRGLREIAVDEELLANELDSNWEVLGEAIQTVIRAEIVAGRSSIADPYAVLKDLTRGRRIGKAELVEFVTGLDIGQDAKDSLLALTPGSYTGASSRLVDHLS